MKPGRRNLKSRTGGQTLPIIIAAGVILVLVILFFAFRANEPQTTDPGETPAQVTEVEPEAGAPEAEGPEAAAPETDEPEGEAPAAGEMEGVDPVPGVNEPGAPIQEGGGAAADDAEGDADGQPDDGAGSPAGEETDGDAAPDAAVLPESVAPDGEDDAEATPDDAEADGEGADLPEEVDPEAGAEGEGLAGEAEQAQEDALANGDAEEDPAADGAAQEAAGQESEPEPTDDAAGGLTAPGQEASLRLQVLHAQALAGVDRANIASGLEDLQAQLEQGDLSLPGGEDISEQLTQLAQQAREGEMDNVELAQELDSLIDELESR